jgi:hypothetical protein
LFPAQRYSRSVLRYGDGNPASRDFDSLTEWFADVRNNAILVRIPWGKLFFTDPSSRRVFAGIDQALKVNTTISEGVDISVYQLKPTKGSDKLSAMAVMSAFPQTEDIKPERVTWQQWDSVKPEPYLKKSYYAIQKEYENRTPRTSVNRNRVPARVRRVAGHLGAGR